MNLGLSFSSEDTNCVLYCPKCGTAWNLFLTVETIHGRFILCRNFPKCTNYIKPSALACMQLNKVGLEVYSWERECYKCHKSTRVYTYFLDYQLQDEYVHLGSHIGLGNIYTLDKLMMKRYGTIKMCNTKRSDFLGKIATNTCEHCGAIQGYYYVVEDPHEADIEFNHSKYLYEIIPCYWNKELEDELVFLDNF